MKVPKCYTSLVDPPVGTVKSVCWRCIAASTGARGYVLVDVLRSGEGRVSMATNDLLTIITTPEDYQNLLRVVANVWPDNKLKTWVN